MNILLCGAAGYIGTPTIIELDKAGHSVVVVDNFSNSKPEALKRVSELIGKDIRFYEATSWIRRLWTRSLMRTSLML